MARPILVLALLLAIGAVIARFVLSAPPTAPAPALPHGDAHAAPAERVEVERRLKLLEARLAWESAERRRLEARLEVVTAQLAMGGSGADGPATAPDTASAPTPAPDAVETGSPGAMDASAADPGVDDDSRSPMERALAAAGVDADTAAGIKHRRDTLTMSEMYLRDQATREQWLDSERFNEEMAALAAQQTSIRDEIGDDAYDRYLYALGEANRVRVDDVLSQSPAAQAGLLAGDMIVRYGEARIFAPSELVAETRGGTAGERVRLEIIRNGERLEIEVPRGPLGLRVAATQASPETS